MHAAKPPHRSFERITRDDLVRLAELALQDFEQLYARSEYSRPYKARLRLICLCQGSARHFLHGDRGVQDFDIWGFFEEIPRHPFPYRRRGTRDFGPSKFGRNPDDGPEFVGRRVDVIGRSIPMPANQGAIGAVQGYLRAGTTESALRLRDRPVIVMWPAEDVGRVIWNPA